MKLTGSSLLKRKCKITFIAHGATIHSQEGIISDMEKFPPLTEHGYNEMKRVCEYIKKRGIRNNKIFTSPALRCIQSAQVICDTFMQDYEVLNELSVRKCGKFNGKSYKEIIKDFPKNPPLSAVNFEDGESLPEFNARVVNVIKKLVAENEGNRLIIVTYPSVIQAAVAHILDIAPENQSKILVKTGSLTQISCFDNWSSLIYSGYVPL